MFALVRFFSIERQFFLLVGCLALGLLLQFTWGLAWSWMPFLVVIILLIKYFLLGTVNAAAMKMQEGDWTGAERMLNYTRKPEWLQFGYHGMFYLMKSRIAFQKEDIKEAEALSHKALSLNLQDDMAAMVYMQLIGIAGKRQQQQKVMDYLKEMKKLHITQPMIKEQMKEIELMTKGEHPMQKKMMQGKQQQMQNFMMKRKKH